MMGDVKQKEKSRDPRFEQGEKVGISVIFRLIKGFMKLVTNLWMKWQKIEKKVTIEINFCRY